MMEKEYCIVFDPSKCSQCYGCETACKSWRGTAAGVRYRKVYNLWNGTYPEIKSGSLSLGCLHCLTPACLEACPVEAISKKEDGLVLVDEELCIGCRACEEACDYGVPQFGEDGIMHKCDLCTGMEPALSRPACVDTCPGEALELKLLSPGEKLRQEEAVKKLLQRPTTG